MAAMVGLLAQSLAVSGIEADFGMDTDQQDQFAGAFVPEWTHQLEVVVVAAAGLELPPDEARKAGISGLEKIARPRTVGHPWAAERWVNESPSASSPF